jgi:uncharacterized OB-fold protein
MSATAPDLVVARCLSCHGRSLPRPGPCPRCGATDLQPEPIPPEGEVLAATELLAPSAGWPAPHRLALIVLAEEVRILAVVEGPLPAIGGRVRVRAAGDHFVAESGGANGAEPGRGEGESPGRGTPRPL